jgi:hypothetical protein
MLACQFAAMRPSNLEQLEEPQTIHPPLHLALEILWLHRGPSDTGDLPAVVHDLFLGGLSWSGFYNIPGRFYSIP